MFGIGCLDVGTSYNSGHISPLRQFVFEMYFYIMDLLYIRMMLFIDWQENVVASA
jgi:hypothetical protein